MRPLLPYRRRRAPLSRYAGRQEKLPPPGRRPARGARWLLAGAVLAILAAPPPASLPQATDADQEAAVQRALGLFDGEPGDGGLPLTAALVPDPQEEGAAARATVEALVARDALTGRAVELRAWVVQPRLETEPLVLPLRPAPQRLPAGSAWVMQASIDLPEDFLEAVVVVEEPASGRWGAAVAEPADRSLTADGEDLVVWRWDPGPAAGAAGEESREAVVIRLLPPRRAQVSGRVRFRTLVSDPLVLRVEFQLDGAAVSTDDEPPYAAVIDLGPEPEPRRISAVAYGPEGKVLGRDTIGVNAAGDTFEVTIARLVTDPEAGEVELAARVTTPVEGELESVAFYYNQALVGQRSQEPFRVRFAAEPRPSDFVRVLARLADGRELEDARLLAAPTETVRVNLVELYAVVTDRQGQPVTDLPREEFEVRLSGRPVALDRFGPAGEVPLVLGLIVDTSQSMEALMTDTKRAGARFLAEVLRSGDRSFLVDFDTRPRLAHGTTERVTDLLRAFDRLRPDGYTALYDAIIFSLLQFEGADGRRALVLLTDGDDYKSRFSQNRCIEYGRELGVPVYILGLGGILDPRAGLRKIDLEGITEATGGRIFYVAGPAELDQAYATIQAELRSQYLLAFSTERPLSERELASLQVRVRGQDRQVRAVVAGRTIG